MSKQKITVGEDEPHFLGDVGIGETVWWFHRGNLHSDPVPAIVLKNWGAGQLSLMVFQGSSPFRHGETIYHKTHPMIANVSGRVSEVAAGAGCWDFRDDEQRLKWGHLLEPKQEQIKKRSPEKASV